MSDLKKFFESNGGRPCTSAELVEFKRSCTPDEYDAYVAAAKAENVKNFTP